MIWADIKLIPFKKITSTKTKNKDVITNNLIDDETIIGDKFDNIYYKEYFESQYGLDIALNADNEVTNMKVKDLEKVLDLLTIIGSDKQLTNKLWDDKQLEWFDTDVAKKFIESYLKDFDFSFSSLNIVGNKNELGSISYDNWNYTINCIKDTKLNNFKINPLLV
jgi:hypothetical protein